MEQTTANTNNYRDTRPHPVRKKKTNTALLALLRGAMLIIGTLIVVMGLLLIILPMFRVKEIKVEGAKYHTEQQIIEASGIQVGDEMLAIDKNSANAKIWEACYQVKGIAIKRSFSTVKIVVTEYEDTMYTSFGGKYYAVGRDLTVLAASNRAEDFAGLLYAELPAIAGIAVGQPILFANQETDLGYINELVETLKAGGVMEAVSSIDVSKKYSVSYMMENGCCVELGRVGDMAVKLTLINEILSREASVGEYGAVVDVANVQKPTFRTLSAGDVLLG